MKTPPLVSVICLCYNHSHYVVEAMASVLRQSYNNCELIVVDDASSDESVDVIERFRQLNPSVKFIRLSKNAGNCRAFNHGLRISRGEFIIDLAAEDVLMPERIEEGLKAFQRAGTEYGVNFTDAEYIDADGTLLYRHSDRFPHHTVPQGDVYKELIQRYFICPPSMMFSRKVMDHLRGYDESLAYEDFDFWIRSSREFKYCYTPQVLVKKRILANSLSSRQFVRGRGRNHQQTTYMVCEKIYYLNRNREERRALAARLVYEMKSSVNMLHFRIFLKFAYLFFKNIFKI
mgnify:CR=1 FL=1